MRRIHRSIPGRLIGSYLALTIASLGAVAYLVYGTTRGVLEASVEARLQTTTANRAELVSRWMTERVHDVDVLAKNVAVIDHAERLAHRGEGAAPAGQALGALLRLVRDQYGAYHGLSVVDLAGNVLASSGNGHAEPARSDPELREAIAQGRAFCSSAYRHPTPASLALDVASPIVSASGELLGAVVATVDLAAIGALAESMQLPGTGDAYLVDERGWVIAHRDRSQRLPADLSRVEGAAAVIRGRSGIASYVDHRGVPVLGAYQWLPRWKWGLVAEFPRAEALAPIAEARHTLLLMVGLVAVAALLGTLLLVRNVVRPLRELTRAVQAVASGQLDQRLDIAGDDEVAYLTRCFNQMATNLAEARSAMAERIGEATESLEHKNAELAAANAHLARVNAELQQANRELGQQRALVERSARLAAMGEMAAGIAHEINNPLTTMKNLVHSLRATVPTDDIRGRDLAVVAEEIERINLLVLNFLRYARPPKANVAPTSVHDLVEHTLKLLEPQARQKQLSVVTDVEVDLPPALADRKLLTQVLVNLVLNAIQASPEGAEVRVAARLAASGPRNEAEAVEITVADEGPGVSDKSRGKIFNPFFTTKADGSGLGLAISQRIVEEHGGTLTLSSKAGRGATFVVTLERLAR